MKKYFNSLSFFRILAFLSVFLLHLSSYNTTSIELNAAWAVSFFFMVSAFLYGYKFYDKKIKLSDTKSFIVNKIKKIYPLYFIMIILFLPWEGFLHLGGDAVTFFTKLFLQLTMTQCFAVNLDYTYSFNAPAWFISTFMFFMLLTIPFCILLKKIVKNRKRGIIAILIITILDILYINLVFKLNLSRTTFLYVFPTCRVFEFLIAMITGMLFRQTYKEKEATKKRKIVFTILEVATMALLILSIKYLPGWFPRYSNSFIWLIPNIIILLLFSCETGYLSKLLSIKPIVYLGNLTFPAYILHQFIFINYYTIPAINDGMTDRGKLISLLFILFVCFFLASVVNKINFNPTFEFIGNIFRRKKKKR
ncbi:MAG: acyltransferase [Bacilli bacterium]|nr:acyltransferase [Bacilli bacterium]